MKTNSRQIVSKTGQCINTRLGPDSICDGTFGGSKQVSAETNSVFIYPKVGIKRNGYQNCGAEWIRSDWRSSGRLTELVFGLRHKKSHPEQNGYQNCGAEWIRTTDSRIFSPMLYQLSYSTKFWVGKTRYFFEMAKLNLKFVTGNF